MDNKELLDRYVGLYNAGDLDACMELYADDASQRMHDGVFEGIDAIHERLARDLTAFPDARYVVAVMYHLPPGHLFRNAIPLNDFHYFVTSAGADVESAPPSAIAPGGPAKQWRASCAGSSRR